MNKGRGSQRRLIAANQFAVFWTTLTCLLFAVYSANVYALPITASGVNWSLTLDEADRSGSSASLLTFTGTITNDTGGDLLIDAATLDFTASVPSTDYTFDLAPEFLDTLGIIPTTGYSGPLFFVDWIGTVPRGTAGSGTFQLTVDIPGAPPMLAVNFSALVTATPVSAPSGLELTLIGISVLLVSRLRKPAKY